MRHRVVSSPRHGDKGALWLQRSRASYRGLRGEAEEAKRAAEIAALPTVQWRGATLYTIRCVGTTGKGPHDRHVPEAVLWALWDLRYHLCPFHM